MENVDKNLDEIQLEIIKFNGKKQEQTSNGRFERQHNKKNDTQRDTLRNGIDFFHDYLPT